ncbi:MAG: 30S ribosomal protein S12 methylthiotransferase RimO [Desulfatirhabdiaceae bacterium]
MNIHVVTLGCARNQVDSEIMMGRIQSAGLRLVPEPDSADVILVNTCGFIEAAVNESIDTILELAVWKEKGPCHKLIVAGCLPERYRENLAQSMPEVDMWVGTGGFDQILQAVQQPVSTPQYLFPDPDAISIIPPGTPRQLTSSHMVYLKVAEGCDRHCTYCIIPKLRGRQKSRPMADIVSEARNLIEAGFQELVLVAQDTTAYGSDLTDSADMSQLLHKLAGLSTDVWIRFLYGHPESITDDIINAVVEHDTILPYFDLPVQHASDRILRRMGRNYGRDDLTRLVDRIRTRIPNASFRTTLIVGFPGETRDDFKILKSFVQEMRFHHLGVFTYSDAPDLPSSRLSNPVNAKTARYRRDRLMALQMAISRNHQEAWLEKVVDVLIENRNENNLFTGRTWFQAPEVDGITYVTGQGLSIGKRVRVRVTDTLEYDLIGEVE